MNETCLYLFGYPRIERDGRVVEVDTRKAIALIAYLAVTGEAASRDVLSGLLWPDYDQSSARAALRRTLSVLNKAVGEGILEIERERLRVVPNGGLWVDVNEFYRLSAVSGNLESLAGAASLARDNFLSGFSLRDSAEFDNWQFFQSERIGRDLAGVLERLVVGYEQLDMSDQAIEHARRWLALDPLQEDPHRRLMALYAQSGQRGAALRQYRECVRILDQELGVAPLPETTALYQSILENRYETPRKPAAAQATRADEPAAAVEPVAHEASLAGYPFVGREQERELLQTAYEKSRGGHLAVLEGEAGIGKSRLAEEFLIQAERRGARVVRIRCYEGETGLAYGPFISGMGELFNRQEEATPFQKLPPMALAEAARLLPDISSRIPDLPEPPALEGPGAQGRFFESLRQVFVGLLSGDPPGILFLDDVQWADAASLDLLAYFLRRLKGASLLVLATFRIDSTERADRIQQILHEAQRGGSLTRILLDRLSPEDVDRMIHLAGAGLPEETAARLFAETEGLPFFIVEYLSSLRKGVPQPEGEWELPASIRDLLLYRMSEVDEAARQLLSTASVIGHSFDLSLLREASGRSELETVNGVEALLAANLVVERQAQGEPGVVVYDFTHEKLRSLAYQETSLARRRLLHRRVAEALSGPVGTGRDRGALAGLVASHYHLAGNDASAAAYYQQAGDYARAVFANVEAIAAYEAALASGYQDPAKLHEAIGDLKTLQGEYGQAITRYETAAAMADASCQARLERKLGNVHARLGDWELAVSHYQRALESPELCGQAEQAGIYADWSHAASQSGENEEAQRLGQQSLRLAEKGNDQLSLAQAHNALGILNRREGNPAEAVRHLRESLAIARELANPGAEIAALNNLALALAESAELDQAIQLTRQAFSLCRQVGDRHREAALLNNLADLSYEAGNPDDAMQYLRQAVVIFAEIGVESGGMRPEVWKLTEW